MIKHTKSFYIAFLISSAGLVFSPYQSFGHTLRKLPPYNEVIDEIGDLRENYARDDIYPIDEKKIETLLGSPLKDSIKILPIPLILSEVEYKLIQDGSRQRARALLAFFKDVIFDNGSKIKAANVMSEVELHGFFKSVPHGFSLTYLRNIYKNLDSDSIGFAYGPDIVRNEFGAFVVLEDNVGNVGGLGDVAATHNAYFGLADSTLRSPLIRAIREFTKGFSPADLQRTIGLISDRQGYTEENLRPGDRENIRKMEAMKFEGLPVITLDEFRVGLNGLFPNQDRSEPLYLINPEEIDLLDPTADRLALLMSLFSIGKLKPMYSPGTVVLGSKALLPLVEKFISVYLKEKPILRTQPTTWVSDFNEPFRNPNQWVIKKVDGSQGREVYILKDMDETGHKQLKQLIVSYAAMEDMYETFTHPKYVSQKIVDPSYLPADATNTWVKFNVDIRPLNFIVRGKVLPSPVLWGRANWKLPGYLNNVSQNAFEMVITTPSECERSLMMFK